MEKNENLSWKFYALLGSASIGLLGGLYYLYNLFSSSVECDLSEEQNTKLENLSKNYQHIIESHESGEIKERSQSEFAINAFKQINEVSDELFKKEYPDWIPKRRVLLKENKIADYNAFCEYMLSEKMRIESVAAEVTLQKLGLSQTDFQILMEKIPQTSFYELQKEMLQKQSGEKADPAKFSEEIIISAFKTFMVKKNEMDSEFKNLAAYMNDANEEARMGFYLKMEISKYLVDDYLTNEYNLDSHNLLELIHLKGLQTHREIATDLNNLLNEFRSNFNQ